MPESSVSVEPVATTWLCPRCDAVADLFNRDGSWRLSSSMSLVEHVHGGIRVSCREIPVFSEGDMQAAQEALETSRAHHLSAREALRETAYAIDGLAAASDLAAPPEAQRQALAHLQVVRRHVEHLTEGVERTHALVPVEAAGEVARYLRDVHYLTDMPNVKERQARLADALGAAARGERHVEWPAPRQPPGEHFIAGDGLTYFERQVVA